MSHPELNELSFMAEVMKPDFLISAERKWVVCFALSSQGRKIHWSILWWGVPCSNPWNVSLKGTCGSSALDSWRTLNMYHASRYSTSHHTLMSQNITTTCPICCCENSPNKPRHGLYKTSEGALWCRAPRHEQQIPSVLQVVRWSQYGSGLGFNCILVPSLLLINGICISVLPHDVKENLT